MLYWENRSNLKNFPILPPPFFSRITLYLSHCLHILSISFVTMREEFLFVWNTNTFTCVPDSITSHFLNEPRILLKYLGVNLPKNTPHLIHISSQLVLYFFFHITLKVSEIFQHLLYWLPYHSLLSTWFLCTLLYKNCS